MADMINHPPHYVEQSITLEPIDFCRRLPFDLGNVLKYCFRAGKKDGNSERQDLEKALFYVKDAPLTPEIFDDTLRSFFEISIYLTRSNSPVLSAMEWYDIQNLDDLTASFIFHINRRLKEIELEEGTPGNEKEGQADYPAPP